MDNITARHNRVETSLQGLENMVQVFKQSVDGLVDEFEGLREDLASLHEHYKAMGEDYYTAMESATEEKKTVEEYSGMLANAQIEIQLLQDALPEGVIPPNVAFSQARPWKIY